MSSQTHSCLLKLNHSISCSLDSSVQEDTKQGKKSVFERLNGVKGNSALQSRLSKPSSMELDSRPVRRPAKRPVNDARELLLETVAAKVPLSLLLILLLCGYYTRVIPGFKLLFASHVMSNHELASDLQMSVSQSGNSPL